MLITPVGKRLVKLWWRYVYPERILFCGLSACILANVAVAICIPQIVGLLIDRTSGPAAEDNVVGLVVLYAALLLVQFLLAVITLGLGDTLGWRCTKALRMDMIRTVVSESAKSQADRTPGDVLQRIDGDATQLIVFFSGFIIHVVGGVAVILGVICSASFQSKTVGVTFLILTTVAIWVLVQARRRVHPVYKAAANARGVLMGNLAETLEARENATTRAGKNMRARRFDDVNEQVLGAEVKAGLASASVLNSSWIMFGAITAIALAVGARLYLTDSVSIGVVYMIFFYSTFLRDPLEGIASQLSDLGRAAAAGERVMDVLCETKNRQTTAHVRKVVARPSVSVSHLRFGYAEQCSVLEDISFSVSGGKTLAIIGRTGSGKTTLGRLIAGSLKPNGGSVMIGGMNAYWPDGPTEGISHIGQRPALLQGSVRQNITLFDENITDGEIWDALDQLGLREYFHSRFGSLDFYLAPRGGNISAGEAQLVATGRALVRNPSIVIFDEVSAHLDSDLARLINCAIKRIAVGRTLVTITHKLDVLEFVDDVLCLEDGAIKWHRPAAECALKEWDATKDV